MKRVSERRKETFDAEVVRSDLILLVQEVDLWDGGITFHTLCVIISAVCLVISAFLAGIIILGHARHYSKPSEQR
jgi:hypothetical protein